MAEEQKEKPAKKEADKVYSKNYFLPINMLYIGGQKVTAELDKELNERLKPSGKKASDYHCSPEEYDKNMELSRIKIGIKKVKAKAKKVK